MKKNFLTGYAILAYLATGAGSEGGASETLASRAQDAIGNTMTKENAVQILNSRKLITEPGKYTAKVTNITPFERPDSEILTNIINFAAMNPYNLKEAKRLIKEGNYQEATNQNLTRSARVGMDYSPLKGELCDIWVDFVELKDLAPGEDPRFPEGRVGQTGLLVVACQPTRTSTASNIKLSLDDFDEEEETSLVMDEATAAVENRKKSMAQAAENAPAV